MARLRAVNGHTDEVEARYLELMDLRPSAEKYISALKDNEAAMQDALSFTAMLAAAADLNDAHPDDQSIALVLGDVKEVAREFLRRHIKTVG